MPAADHPEWLGILADILARPEDDGARCVAADWLSDHGEGERGEFIRVGVEFPRTRCLLSEEGDDPYFAYCNNSDCPHCDLDRRATRLLQQDAVARCNIAWIDSNEARWLPRPFARAMRGQMQAGDTDAVSLEWRRGFLARVRLPLAAWLAHGPALVRGQPIENVRLSDREPEADLREYGWYTHGWGRVVNEPSDLPSEIFALLAGGRQVVGGEGWRWYPTADAAHADLSRACLLWACIAWARQAALGPDAGPR